MKKEDLKVGNILETRCGEKILVCNTDEWIKLTGIKVNKLVYHEKLIFEYNHKCDVMKVYEDYTCQKVLWERKDIKPTEDEKAILKNLPKKWKYIARDEDSSLWIFDDYKPYKAKTSPKWLGNIGEPLYLFQHLFQFIKWEDKKPYLISDLLKEEE